MGAKYFYIRTGGYDCIAIKAGRNVYVAYEKSFEEDLDQIDELVRIADEYNKYFDGKPANPYLQYLKDTCSDWDITAKAWDSFKNATIDDVFNFDYSQCEHPEILAELNDPHNNYNEIDTYWESGGSHYKKTKNGWEEE